jgi:UDP-N-acetylmuramoylalanine--D-glutamate ligase
VLIIGLGRSGVAAAKFAAMRGAHVTVSEEQEAPAVEKSVRELHGLPIQYSFGGNDPQLMMQADIIVISPGVPLTIDGLETARHRGVHIIGELELAVREIQTPIIAVTGTNGKTTTTTLIGHLLTTCGLKSCVGGNIGTALTNLIDDAKGADWVVVEVSSYQLETTPSLAPHIGVLLNVTPDHLDRHTSFEEYARLKAQLFNMLGTDGFGIYNVADTVVAANIKKSPAYLIPFDATGRTREGGWYENGDLVIHLPKQSRERYRLDKVRLKGTHNLENLLAAVMTTSLCGGDHDRIQKGLETFEGLPHRIQLVGEYGGIKYYDDSKGTNVGATAAALENFHEPVVLIAGGLDKGGSYAPLAKPIRKHVKQLILIGQAKQKMKKELGTLTKVLLAESMEEAVQLASKAAVRGGVVLLSPACASFDMFRDYTERGEVFARAVKNIHRRDAENAEKT